jgi:hypothetical protein
LRSGALCIWLESECWFCLSGWIWMRCCRTSDLTNRATRNR